MAVDFGHDEINGLIDLIEDSAFETLIGGDGFADFGAVEVETFSVRSEEKMLGVVAKEEDSCVVWVLAIQQMEMSKGFWRWGAFSQDIVAATAGFAEEPAELSDGKIFQAGAVAGRGVERRGAKESLAYEVFD